jgi:hypothetical protein
MFEKWLSAVEIIEDFEFRTPLRALGEFQNHGNGQSSSK